VRYVIVTPALDLVMQRRGMSIRELSDATGISRSRAARMIKGETTSAVAGDLYKIAAALRIDAPLIADIPEGLW
jgi:transcriptional regulator with XRE-family HTH domain